MAKKYKLRIAMSNIPGKKAVELDDEEKQWLTETLDRADLSYVNSGRKDNVYIGKKDGEWKYCQKRYFLWNLQDY